MRFSERKPGAARAARQQARLANHLTARTRSERIEQEGKQGPKCLDRSPKREQARRLCVSTIVLSETRGLKLFSVVRGGIELTKRLRRLRPIAYVRVGYSSRTRAFRELGTGQGRMTHRAWDLVTLKLLAVSIALDRSVLPSSKSLKRSPQSCELTSAAPWRASCRSRPNFMDTDLPAHPPGVIGLCGRTLERHFSDSMIMVGIQ